MYAKHYLLIYRACMPCKMARTQEMRVRANFLHEFGVAPYIAVDESGFGDTRDKIWDKMNRRFWVVNTSWADLLWFHTMYIGPNLVVKLCRTPEIVPGPRNEQNEQKWTFSKNCPDRSQTTWNRFVLILDVTLWSFKSLGRSERLLEDVYNSVSSPLCIQT